MKYKLKTLLILILVFLMLPWTGQVAKADDVKGTQGTTISLKIQFEGDDVSCRPDAIYVELYRSVDGTEQAIETRKITLDPTKNSVTSLFSGLDGETWEYAFHVVGADDITDLYAYTFSETGAGTQKRVFTYTYGTGKTEMEITVNWSDDGDAGNVRPDHYEINLFSLDDTSGVPERTITMTEKNASSSDPNVWKATVTGLKGDPSQYAISPTQASSDYVSRVVRGDTDSSYVMTNTYVVQSQESVRQENASAVAGLVSTLQKRSDQDTLLHQTWFNVLLILIIIVLSSLLISKHRRIAEKMRKNRPNRKDQT